MVESVDIEVSKYLNRKFWEWEAGKKKTQTEFAIYLGVEPGTFGHWMSGRNKPDYDNCLLLSKKFGPEIFNVCGYLGPNPQLRKVVSLWNKISDRGKGIFLETVMEAVNQDQVEQADYGSKPSILDR